MARLETRILEYPSLLESIAGASVTLAGFAAVFRAFASRSDPDGFSAIRLNVVIEGGLVVALVCYLPAILAGVGLPGALAWRLSSGLGALWLVFRTIGPGIYIIRRGWPLPALFPLAFALTLTAFGAFAIGAAGFGPLASSSAHQLGIMALAAQIGTTFVAQFQVERQ